ncbi:nucleotide exchange factor GrpE [Myxococcota bacterium]|nr:nucleotide exchange factor GrpE [Myxococcota bacterium]MBU1429240.1 nucleotide exchange factor GrpE [Myxococcota bacterium]MBU1897993.1 nucleotide exchange factor GrpE [Myxococcota bacterium]
MKDEALLALELSLDMIEPETEELGPPVDLRALMGELIALKAEVRRETSEVKAIREALHATPTADHAADRAADRAAARALIDVLARLRAGVRCAQPPRRRWWGTPRRDVALDALLEGLALSCARIEGALADLGVERISTLATSFDPIRMEAVGIRAEPSQPDGLVIEEVRAGYQDSHGVLQVAQVIVNRREELSHG